VYTSSGLTYYRHSDWIGSSRFASTPTRTMYSDGAYAPFGESYLQTGTADVSFTGMNQDTVANLYDFPAREYNDIHGRWPSPDPLGLWAFNPSDPQTLNRYVYVRNSPQENTDPAGLCVGNTGGPAEKNTGKCRYSPNPDALAKNWSEPIWGNDVFDALEGAPGTFMYTDMRGNVGFGWDYSLYIATESEMAQLSQLTDNTQPSSPTGPDIPLPPIPQAFFAVTIEYNGTDTLTSGFVPELISSLTQQILDVGAFAQAYSKVAGNPAAQQQVMNEWAPYLEYDVEASARVRNTFFGLFD
jgi:RHS repeat-associated protein